MGRHIEPQDLGHDLERTMLNTLMRELSEEIGVTGTPSPPEFAVYAPRSPHLGIVHSVSVEELHQPKTNEFADQPPLLIGLDELDQMTDQLDPWSALIVRRRATNHEPQ